MTPVKNSNMAIYFDDKDYLEAFMNYIAERNIGFICSGFTRSENLKAYAEQNSIAVLLTDYSCFKENARNINSEITFVLTEKPETDTPSNVYEINILQPVDEILKEILKTAAKTDISVAQNHLLTDGNVHCFFSPVGRSLKTTLAMAASQILSDREKTIYLNLESDSGFSVLFGQDFSSDLSDIMFYLKDEAGDKASLLLQSSICSCQGASFIPPVVNPGDIFQISPDEILKLIDLLQNNGFKNIVIDIGTLLPGFERIFSVSRKIYMPVRKDAMSSAKIAQLFSYLRTLEDLPVEEKIVWLEPPYFKDIPSLASNYRGTEVGSYIAGILYEQQK